MTKCKVSYAPSVRRLPSYLLIAKQALEHGDEYLSGTLIAQELNLEPIQVRKDLAITGVVGKPKRGIQSSRLSRQSSPISNGTARLMQSLSEPETWAALCAAFRSSRPTG